MPNFSNTNALGHNTAITGRDEDNCHPVSAISGLAVYMAKLDTIEGGATEDQTDSEIKTAYDNQVPQVSAGEKNDGTETNVRRYSPEDIRDMSIIHSGAALQNKYDAVTYPGVNDDSPAGYSIGSTWINQTSSPTEAFRCHDATEGSAVWVKTTLTSDELATVALTGDYRHLTNKPIDGGIADGDFAVWNNTTEKYEPKSTEEVQDLLYEPWGTRSSSFSFGSVYQAAEDGFVTGKIWTSTKESSSRLLGYTDSSASPTTVMDCDMITPDNVFTKYAVVKLEVNKNHYWMVTVEDFVGTHSSPVLYFMPKR